MPGTEVAREASDIILLDDSFASITNAVWWGRSLYENIQRFVLFQLTISFCACILVFIAPLLGYPAPFTIIQILWINIIMDTLAAFALCSEAPHRGLMNRLPIPHDANIITPFMGISIIVTGPDNPRMTPSAWITLNAAVNSTAHLEDREGRTMVIGNSTEGALLFWLRSYALDYLQIRAETHVIRQYLFEGGGNGCRRLYIVTAGPGFW